MFKQINLPPPISPLVAMADIDMAVTKVMNVEMAMMMRHCPFITIKVHS